MTRGQFIEMVKAEQEQLRRFLLSLCCGNRYEADDIAQDALVKAYLSDAKYKEQGRSKVWLYRIAYYTFIDARRSRSETLPLELAQYQQDETFAADRDLRYQPLYAALNELQPKERSVILLFYIQGYSVIEIAEIVDETEDAVKKQLSRGRMKLKTILKDE